MKASKGVENMLGAFSISLNVKDIKKSFDFYSKLGFKMIGGKLSDHWVIMKQDEAVIGLFQGMIEKNTITFNPGWNQNAEEVNPFNDIRVIQRQLMSKGIVLKRSADFTTKGPEHIELIDPDGNPILIDQHR